MSFGRNSSRAILCAVAAAVSAVGVLAACSDDEARPPFDGEGPPAVIPDAAAYDAPFIPDAPEDRGPFDPADEPVTCEAGATCVVQIVAGDSHFCARMSDGTVRCWGDDEKGQLGGLAGDSGAQKPPVTDLAAVTQISAASETTCARGEDGSVSCWGSNAQGQLALPALPGFDDEAHPVPTKVTLESAEIARVDVGHGNVCATTDAGAVYCWGADQSLKLGHPDGGSYVAPPALAELGVVVKRTASGLSTSFAVTTEGKLVSWGAVAGPEGVLSGRSSSVTPTAIPNFLQTSSPVSSLAVAGPTPGLVPPGATPGSPAPPPNQHACVVMNGDVFCWGNSERGALGSGQPDSILKLPFLARIESKAYAQQVAAGGKNTCARMTDGRVFCTGQNDRGQLGTGTAGPFSSTFTSALSVVGRVVSVAVARESACALLQGGEVSCWGGNLHGELGLGSRDRDPHPSATKVPF